MPVCKYSETEGEEQLVCMDLAVVVVPVCMDPEVVVPVCMDPEVVVPVCKAPAVEGVV